MHGGTGDVVVVTLSAAQLHALAIALATALPAQLFQLARHVDWRDFRAGVDVVFEAAGLEVEAEVDKDR